MQNEALLNMIQDLTFETICYELDSVSDYIESEFRKILDKYGIWYEMGHSWSLTCYYQQVIKERMNMIYITGDTHGDFDYKKLIIFIGMC